MIVILNKIASAIGCDISELFEKPDSNVFACPKCGTVLVVWEKL